MGIDIIDELYNVILDRKANPPAKSYVVRLLNGGVDAIGAKVVEEASELVEAAGNDDRDHTVHEAADLLFHMLVLLGYHNIAPDEIRDELGRRFGLSGITEKENRRGNH